MALGLTILTLREPVVFGSEQNDPVRLVITLATPDEKSHMRMLEELSEFLMTDGMADRLMAAESVTSAENLFQEVRSA